MDVVKEDMETVGVTVEEGGWREKEEEDDPRWWPGPGLADRTEKVINGCIVEQGPEPCGLPPPLDTCQHQDDSNM